MPGLRERLPLRFKTTFPDLLPLFQVCLSLRSYFIGHICADIRMGNGSRANTRVRQVRPNHGITEIKPVDTNTSYFRFNVVRGIPNILADLDRLMPGWSMKNCAIGSAWTGVSTAWPGCSGSWSVLDITCPPLVSSDRSIPISDSKAMNIVTGGSAYTACDTRLDGLSMILNRMDRDVTTMTTSHATWVFWPVKYFWTTTRDATIWNRSRHNGQRKARCSGIPALTARAVNDV